MVSTERDSLVTLFGATRGSHWQDKYGWETDAELSTWFGVNVNDQGRVITLWLHENNLQGYLLQNLGDLGVLRELNLSGNDLTGALPKELGNLTALTMLKLSSNRLAGAIPKELGNLTTLKVLFLSDNHFEGTVPAELGALDSLEVLSLSYNRLTALWDHTQEVPGASHELADRSVSGWPIPGKLRRLLDAFDGAARFLRLEGNPWAEPPESVVVQGWKTDMKAIRGYFEDLYAEPCRVQRNSVKVILVGQEGAGKTSLRQSMKERKAAPTSEWKQESTVFADVELMEIEDVSVRVYDCAGQVAYTGILQMFLTPRAVCALVCNAEAFGQVQHGTDDQLEEDCRKLEELRVFDWLRSISWRVPNNDVILVATKCDRIGGNAVGIGRRMENACQDWIHDWVDAGMSVRVEPGVSLTSCATEIRRPGEISTENPAPADGWACDWRDNADDDPPPSLRHRLVSKPGGGLRGAQMVLPRSWDIALTVLEALERGRDPVEMVMQKLADPDQGRTEGAAHAKAGVYQGITVEDLTAKWRDTVLALEKKGINVINAENALEGALSIREFDGSLVRHESFIFLDVLWLARVLKPLLNHKCKRRRNGSVFLGDAGDTSATAVNLVDEVHIRAWERLDRMGVLEPKLAHAMWPAGLSNYVLPTLESLGLAFPLKKDVEEGLVVLLRLKGERPESVGKVIDTFCSEHIPLFCATWEVFLGVPPGAIEKMLTRCCGIGGVQTFWRSGVLVHGGLGDQDSSGVFAVLLEYSQSDNRLTGKVYGDINSPAPWTALSYVISAVKFMLLEFPGLHPKGSLECPQHGDAMLLANNAIRAGDSLLERDGCWQCSPDTRGLGAAAVELLRMVDILLGRDEIFDEFKARFVNVEGRYALPRPSVSFSLSSRIIFVMCLHHAGRQPMSPYVDNLTTPLLSLLDYSFAMEKSFTHFLPNRRLCRVINDVGVPKDGGHDDEDRCFDDIQGILRSAHDALLQKFNDMANDVKGGLDEMKLKLDQVAAVTRESLTRLKTLQAPDYLYPRLVTVKEIKSCDASSKAQRKRTFIQKLRGVGAKEMKLHFLCPVDMTEVSCGCGGEGYRFRETRDWVKKLSPVLQVAVVTAKVALKATTGLGVEVSDFLNAVKDGLFEELVAHALDEDALHRVISGDEDAGTDMQRDARASYEALNKFMDKQEMKGHTLDDYVDFRDKMQRVTDGKGGMVWVKNENVNRWLSSL
ncbi:unnamed protein product [Scytosiphon promiscuus]